MKGPAAGRSICVDARCRQSAMAVQNPSVRERLGKLGVDPMISSAAAFEKLVREEVSTNTRIATAVGIKAD
jgi:tripartite-type tricarboxylate transporter receptor subunit TctC